MALAFSERALGGSLLAACDETGQVVLSDARYPGAHTPVATLGTRNKILYDVSWWRGDACVLLAGYGSAQLTDVERQATIFITPQMETPNAIRMSRAMPQNDSKWRRCRVRTQTIRLSL